ncbi:MAG: hypothetical protein ACJ73E_01810 [Mycobacteriales bacterium]
MSTARLLPLGAPVAAGLVTTAGGARILLFALGLLLMLLAVRSVLLHDRTAEGPRR